MFICKQKKKIKLLKKKLSIKCIDSLSEEKKDKIYRMLWSGYVKEDVKSYADNIGTILSNEEIEVIVQRYVYCGDYDCNLSYWDNIENLIKEVKGEL